MKRLSFLLGLLINLFTAQGFCPLLTYSSSSHGLNLGYRSSGRLLLALTDFDDSVFDDVFGEEERSQDSGRMKSKTARETRQSYNAKASVVTSVAGVLQGTLTRGDHIRVKILRMDRLGAYVELLDHLNPQEEVRLLLFDYFSHSHEIKNESPSPLNLHAHHK